MRILRGLLVAAHATCVWMAWPALAHASDDVVAAGRRIYQDGIDRDGVAVAARLPGSGWRLPPAAARCANCHGLGGEGGAEGLVRPPSLRWVRDDEASQRALERALKHRTGRDGRSLHAAMPVFDLDRESLAALTKHLAGLREPQAVRQPLLVGLLPHRAAMTAEESALEAELMRCLGSVAGGEAAAWRWRLARYETPEQAAATLRTLLLDDDVAIIVSPALGRWQRAFVDAIDALAAHGAVPPVLFPLTAEAETLAPGAPVHWLFGGRHESGVALELAAQQLPALSSGSRRVAVPARSAPAVAGAARALGTVWGAASCAVVSRVVASAPARQAGQAWADWARAALALLPRIDTADGLSVQASANVAVQEWSVWEQSADGRWTLLVPAVSVATPRR